MLCNADGGPGGLGANLTVPLQGELADGQLGGGGSFSIEFKIGLASFRRFFYFVEMFGAVAT